MDFAASISTAEPEQAPRAVPTEGLVIEHHRTGAAEVSFAVPSGGHLLHLAIATCVFNDLHASARARGITLGRVQVRADGGFDEALTRSTGVELDIEAEGTGHLDELGALVQGVVENAVIVRIVRASAEVRLRSLELRSTPPGPV